MICVLSHPLINLMETGMLKLMQYGGYILFIVLFLASALRCVYHYERQSIFDKDRGAKYVYFCGFLYVLGVGIVSALTSNSGGLN